MAASASNIRRVLFVDDELQFLEVIKGLMMAFSGGTWEVSTADSPSSAFAVLQEQPIDLVVVDVQMGVIDGVQMLSLLNRGYPNVQKVVLTGFANEKYRAACLSNGAELFLEKPINEKGWENLYTVLDELAKHKPEEGFRGVLRRVGIQDVLQMECLARSSSILEISNAQGTGQIFVDHGQIIHAQIRDSIGEDAFNLMMGLTGGHFNLKPFQEPPQRSISGPWEFLLMEAARKRDEALEAAEGKSKATTISAEKLPPLLPTEIPAIKKASPSDTSAAPTQPAPAKPILTKPAAASAAPMIDAACQPKVDEFLICTPQGEVLHEWQCRNVHVWVNFFEFLSQRAQRIEKALPMGEFERLEIQNEQSRAVVIIATDKGVMVRTRLEPAEKPS